MSGKIIGMIMERYPAQHGEYKLALALGNFASEDGRNIYPSVETMAAYSRQDVRSVQRHLKRMLETGWLLLVRAGGGRGRPAVYQINPCWMAGEDFPTQSSENGDTVPGFGISKTTTPATENDDMGDATYKNHREPNTPLPPKGGDLFDALLAEYPSHRRNVAAARKRWDEIAPDQELQAVMVQAAKVQARSPEWQARNGQSVPNLSKWLLNHGWRATHEDSKPTAEQPSIRIGGRTERLRPDQMQANKQRLKALADATRAAIANAKLGMPAA